MKYFLLIILIFSILSFAKEPKNQWTDNEANQVWAQVYNSSYSQELQKNINTILDDRIKKGLPPITPEELQSELEKKEMQKLWTNSKESEAWTKAYNSPHSQELRKKIDTFLNDRIEKGLPPITLEELQSEFKKKEMEKLWTGSKESKAWTKVYNSPSSQEVRKKIDTILNDRIKKGLPPITSEELLLELVKYERCEEYRSKTICTDDLGDGLIECNGKFYKLDKSINFNSRDIQKELKKSFDEDSSAKPENQTTGT